MHPNANRLHARIHRFLEDKQPATPCIVVDTDIIQNNYAALAQAMPDAAIYYAVKANPAAEILSLLAGLGSSFDAASLGEIDLVLDAGVSAERISFGNTIKKKSDIAGAYQRGVRLFAIDCIEEADKVADAAPGARVFCRLLASGDGADWPLSRKFGCDTGMAIRVIDHAKTRGLTPIGVSFHTGSQQSNPRAWDQALAQASYIFSACAEMGIELDTVNLGGGFPTQYLRQVPEPMIYGRAIEQSLRQHFGNRLPATMIEPGRGMVGNAGVIKSEVLLVSKKSDEDEARWVYLDIGKFGGLAETMEEAIRYPLVTAHDGGETGPCIIAGPTCDSADVLYEKTPYELPFNLMVGDEILIENTGAYTTTYSSVGFNGFPPLQQYIL